ncbi:invasion associated locus B family protein [Mesorhizobium sp. B2-4-14]|uniref:invasion associated locus B family protein n=1 Tax=Mesorhizobium sp. B2-4-14 TaxID=2589935 RepID=UPI0015E44D7D|nr:invasion associated locus B family protein [Mesorhizobium sp. B2-4-14]
MARKKAASLLATILLLSGADAQAAVYRELQGWPGVRDVPLMTDPNYGRRADQGASSMGRPPASLPNGADAVKETYDDWAVECRVIQNNKRCSVGQFQYDEQQRALMFSIEIFPPDNNGNCLVAVTMPFGLNLSDAVILRLDDHAFEQPQTFATCMPTGCLVPFKLTNSSIETMKKGKIMMVGGKSYGSEKDANFTVSLKGFPAAIERLRTFQQ